MKPFYRPLLWCVAILALGFGLHALFRSKDSGASVVSGGVATASAPGEAGSAVDGRSGAFSKRSALGAGDDGLAAPAATAGDVSDTERESRLAELRNAHQSSRASEPASTLPGGSGVERNGGSGAPTVGAASSAPSRRYADLTPTQRALRGTDVFFDIVKMDAATRAEIERLATEDRLYADEISQRERRGELTFQEARDLGRQSLQEMDRAIDGLLGEGKGMFFGQLQVSQTHIPMTEDFASRCARAGEPLSLEALAATRVNLFRNIPRHADKTGSHVLPSSGRTQGAYREERAFRVASETLTPKQLELFKEFWAEKPRLENY